MIASLFALAVVASQPVAIAGPLHGTQTGDGKAPVALIMAGSGPTDRDGNNPLGVKAAPYRMLAEALAGDGITTVRADKRGMFESAAASADPNKVFPAILAADAHAWAADIRKRTGAPCVWLIGHSEGGLEAMIAGQDGTDLCGVILVAAPGRRLGDVVREQLRANPANAPILPDALGAIDALEKGQDVDVSKMHPALQQLFAPAIQPFWKAAMAYDPTKLVAGIKGPVLIVQGKTDIQVSVADAEVLKAARPDATLVEIEGVNHLLKAAPADRAGNLATYGNPDLPIAPAVVDAIAGFINGHK